MSPLRRISNRALATMAGTTVERLQELAEDPAPHYQRRSHVGRKGKVRILTVPSDELKGIQRRLLRGLFDPLVPHDCSACTRGRGAVWMMKRHQRHPYLLSLDIQDFFPSVTRSRVSDGLTRLGLSSAEELSSLLTVNDELPQGAPTSVAVGDIALFPLDSRIEGLARSNGLVYSRYVDDLVVSGGGRVRSRFQKVIERFIAEEGWSLNDKGGVSGPRDRRTVLGSIVNAKPNVSRRYFSDVRSYLRLISRGAIRPSAQELESLTSRVSWIAHVNAESGPALRALLQQAVTAASREDTAA